MKLYKLLDMKMENIDFSGFEKDYEEYKKDIKEKYPERSNIIIEDMKTKFKHYYFYEDIWVKAED